MDNILIVFLVFIIGVMVYSLYLKSDRSKEKEKVKREQTQTENLTLRAKHFHGLPIAKDAVCEISYLTDSIKITQSGNTFNLDINKVTDISHITDVEIQKQYVSSVGGAVGGALLFGPLGAMIGGRATQKQSKNKTYYLVITYKDNDELKYISFQRDPSYIVGKFTCKFKCRENKAQSITEL